MNFSSLILGALLRHYYLWHQMPRREANFRIKENTFCISPNFRDFLHPIMTREMLQNDASILKIDNVFPEI